MPRSARARGGYSAGGGGAGTLPGLNVRQDFIGAGIPRQTCLDRAHGTKTNNQALAAAWALIPINQFKDLRPK